MALPLTLSSHAFFPFLTPTLAQESGGGGGRLLLAPSLTLSSHAFFSFLTPNLAQESGGGGGRLLLAPSLTLFPMLTPSHSHSCAGEWRWWQQAALGTLPHSFSSAYSFSLSLLRRRVAVVVAGCSWHPVAAWTHALSGSAAAASTSAATTHAHWTLKQRAAAAAVAGAPACHN
eukprot:1157517-Pelagomonas_calceolata.AAC.11